MDKGDGALVLDTCLDWRNDLHSSADLACHWEDADTVAQEVYVSVSSSSPRSKRPVCIRVLGYTHLHLHSTCYQNGLNTLAANDPYTATTDIVQFN